MNADLENTVEGLGPAYRDVVARLRASREVEPMRAGQRGPAPGRASRSPLFYLAAASLAGALALAVLHVLPRGGDAAADVPLTIYTVAYAPTEEARDERMRVAYRRAVRYLRTKGLSPLTDAELKARGEYAAKSRLGA